MSSGVTASMRAEISSGVNSSAPVMTLRPTRFILAEVLSRARSVELLSCCLVRSSSSSSTASSITLSELPDYHPDGLLHVAGGGADVGLDRARVGVSLVVGVDGVSEPALLAHLLEEAAAHAAAEHVVERGHRVAVLAPGRDPHGAHGDVVLLRLLEPEVEAALGRRRTGLPDERLSFRQTGELLLDLPLHVVGVELARGDHEDVGAVYVFLWNLFRVSWSTPRTVSAEPMIGRPRGSSLKMSEERYSSASWSGLSSYILISSTITSRSRSRSARVGLQDHVAHHVEGAPEVLGQEPGVEHGVLLARRRVLLGAYALEGLRDAEGVHVGGALEEHVLHQVADARDLVLLVARAGPDPDSQRDARGLRQGLGEDPQAPGKVLPPYVGIGH